MENNEDVDVDFMDDREAFWWVVDALAVGGLSVDSIREAVESHPGVMTFKGEGDDGDDDWNLLHWAAFGSSPEDVVTYLASKNPSLLKERSAKGLTPLHVAAMYGASSETLTSLAENERGGALVATSSAGLIPLHLAATNPGLLYVNAILARGGTRPASSSSGLIPLHLAATTPGLLYVDATLVGAQPSALMEADMNDEPPLHVAAEFGAPLLVVEFLASRGREAL